MKILSNTSQELLDDLCKSAMSWGYINDQGVGSEVDKSEKEYLECCNRLVKRIGCLENKIKKLRGRNDIANKRNS